MTLALLVAAGLPEGAGAATSKATTRRKPAAKKPVATSVKRPAPTAAKALPLKLVRPQPAAAKTAPIAWRVCPGIEESALVQVAAAPGQAVSVSWTPTRPLSGCRVTGQMIPGPTGSSYVLVQLKPPAGARPGRYDGTLTVRLPAANGSAGKGTVAQLKVAAEVLPFELMRPSKQYAVSRVPVGSGECQPADAADAAAFRQLREIGIGALSLEAAPHDRASLEETMRSAGLRGPVLVPVPEVSAVPVEGDSDDPGNAAAAEGVVPDNPPAQEIVPAAPRRPTAMAYTIRWYSVYDRTPPAAEALAALKADGTMVACRMEGAGATEGPSGGVDLPIFDAAGEYSTQLLGRSGSLGASMNGWWRWDAGTASALDNRLRSGALLWKSGLSGALAEINPEAAADGAWPLRWDGVRQGLLDSRYLTTFFAVMRQVKDKDRSSRLPGEAEAAVMAALKGLSVRPSPAAADRFRTVTVDWIVRLRRVAGS